MPDAKFEQSCASDDLLVDRDVRTMIHDLFNFVQIVSSAGRIMQSSEDSKMQELGSMLGGQVEHYSEVIATIGKRCTASPIEG